MLVRSDDATSEHDPATRDVVAPTPDETPLFPTDDADPSAAVDAVEDGPAATLPRAPRRSVQVAMDDEPTTIGATVGPPTEVVALTGGIELGTCSACGAVNAVERRRCARCGAALLDELDKTSGESAPASSSSDAPALPPTDVSVAPSRRRLPGVGIAIVVVGAVVGAVLAALVFGVGPFDRGAGVGVAFDGDGYPGQAGPLSAVPSATTPVRDALGERTFTADQAVDDDLGTAWVAVDGDDAALEFQFDQPVWVVSVEVANGDQYDDETFAATARIRTLEVDFGFGSTIEAILLSGIGRQDFRPPEPVLTEAITLEVLEVTDGADVALSDITFVGYEANAQDARAFAEAG